MSLFERSKNNQRNGLRGEDGGSFVPWSVLLPLPLEETAAPAGEKQVNVSDVEEGSRFFQLNNEASALLLHMRHQYVAALVLNLKHQADYATYRQR